jgi:hypothetical protein
MNSYVMTLHFLIGHLLLRQYAISHDGGGGGGGGDGGDDDDDDDDDGNNGNICKGSIMTCLLIYGFCMLQKCR